MIVALWVVLDALREIHWERRHPEEFSPWRMRRLMARIDQAWNDGYTGVLVLPERAR